ncbi:MAG TPA: bifunctional UDP-N-acetylglucosamine diphosphorylase/glucosamine-1-phosphate N-acetyltransferase GlmU [Caulobacteraceae bacterium]|nr:bifunctional UDP-N-acetylglucosamine diphosphorylase/glucosamine-1-phosphate N-acetyltransferase GlmU [Caulobacteraceae bacterium]
MPRRAAVILAAGQGTRMKSPKPKVLHPVGGRPMLDWVIEAATAAGIERVVVVVGKDAPDLEAHVAALLGPGQTVVQDPPLGTGHAVLAAKQSLSDFDGEVLVACGDGPALSVDEIEPLFALLANGADQAVMGFETPEPASYGRMIMGEDDHVLRVVEARDASPAELAITKCNAAVFAAPAGPLFEWLGRVTPNNAKHEYYLTDIVRIANEAGADVRATFAPKEAFMGVNSLAELAEAEAIFQAKKRRALMDAGVAMTAPETVYLSADTEIAAGARVEPFVVFGPGVTVEAGAVIRAFSHLEGCVVREGALVGPYARLRPGADIGAEAHIGNFVEVKKVRVGKGAKANHLAYLGDGSVGAGANIGAGTIFCNYDGFDKHDTHVGENAFIGSNSALVAPVTIGDGAYTASGSVITKDLDANALGIGRARQEAKAGWATAFRARKAAEKNPKA